MTDNLETLLKELIKKVDKIEAKLDGAQAKYPKPVMKMSELKKMGFSESWLLSIYRRGDHKIAWKTSAASNASILFDTALLEKERKAECVGGY